jgi:hypothetical protein
MTNIISEHPSIRLVGNAYFRVNNKVDVFFIVPILMLVGIFTMSPVNYLLLLFCFIAGFLIKYNQGDTQ